MPTPKQNIQLVTKRRQPQSKTFNQEHKDANLFCFGVGIFMFLVECFVLELASLCSWLNVLF
jgi:hypothetical protein